MSLGIIALHLSHLYVSGHLLLVYYIAGVRANNRSCAMVVLLVLSNLYPISLRDFPAIIVLFTMVYINDCELCHIGFEFVLFMTPGLSKDIRCHA